MRKFLLITGLFLTVTMDLAIGDEKKHDENHVETVKVNEKSNTTLMMKIQGNEKVDESRRQAFIEELRKLYKANFL